MALNATEIAILRRLVGTLSKRHKRRPRVLFLGYPDLLLSRGAASAVGLDLDWDRIDALPVEKSRKIWADHGRGHLADHAMLEAKSLFSSFGADAFVSDAIAWGGEDFELDLNLTLGWWRARRIGRYDIIVDPGTLEHCFNIARAFINLDMLLRPGGFIYHQDAIAFPNHGLWSISPTTFFDFYEPRGYELGQPFRFDRALDADGFAVALAPIDAFAPISSGAMPMIGSYIFRKRRETHIELRLIQRCYSGNSRQIDVKDFHRETL